MPAEIIPLHTAYPAGPHFSCPTCKDEGLPARVLSIDAAEQTALVRLDTGEREVALDLVNAVQVGDFLLVHLDTAIAKLDPSDVTEN